MVWASRDSNSVPNSRLKVVPRKGKGDMVMAVAQKGFQISAPRLPQEWLRDAIVCIDSHTGGEPTRLVVSGIPEISGDSAREKTRFFADSLDHLRTTLTGEPRAHQAMHALVLCPATSNEADFGVIIMCALGYLDMCGHALIGAVTTVLEAGIIKADEPETVVIVETPAGIMRTRAHVVNGKVLSVTFRNQPAFVYKRDLEVCVEPFGNLNVDIAYGGLWYVIVDADQVNISLDISNLDRLSHASRSILKAVNSAVVAEHPILGPAGDLPQLLFTGPPTNPEADGKNFNMSTELGFDRSPCGTGSSARMAVLHAGGVLGLNREYVHESAATGGLFRGRLVEKVKVGSIEAVVPEITGRAHITGVNHIITDPDDPLRHGFYVS